MAWDNKIIDSYKKEGKFDRAEELKMYFIDLIDRRYSFNIHECLRDSDFELKNRIKYVKGGVFKSYEMVLIKRFKRGMTDIALEDLSDILTALERINDIFFLRIIELAVKEKTRIVKIELYHKDDEIEWGDMFSTI